MMASHAQNGSKLRVAIIGGGIAGLSAAAFFRKYSQFDVTVYERRDDGYRENSAAIGLRENGISVVRQLDIDREEIRAVKGAGYRTYNVHEEMMSKSVLPDGPDGEDTHWFVVRQDLKDALLKRVVDEDGSGHHPIKVVCGSRVVGVDAEAGVVTFADGTSVTSELIIGADGIHSQVRKAVIPPSHPEPVPCGLSLYRFMLPMDVVRDAIGSDDQFPAMYDYTEGTFVAIVAAGDQGNRNIVMYPCRGYEKMNIAFAVPDVSVRDPSQLQYSWSAVGNVDEMVEAITGFPLWLQRVLGRAPRVDLFQVRDQEPLPTYVKGRTVLIGDAAHAMVPFQGQGANQALEDVEGLNVLFSDLYDREQIFNVLRIWDSVRRPRASEIQRSSRLSQTKIASKEAAKAILMVKPFVSMREALA